MLTIFDHLVGLFEKLYVLIVLIPAVFYVSSRIKDCIKSLRLSEGCQTEYNLVVHFTTSHKITQREAITTIPCQRPSLH